MKMRTEECLAGNDSWGDAQMSVKNLYETIFELGLMTFFDFGGLDAVIHA